MSKTTVTAKWLQASQFESDNPSNHKLITFDTSEDNGATVGYGPKALMLSGLAGCTGLDVVSLLEKMRASVADFYIEITATLTEEHPKIYDTVNVEYHFKDANLQTDKIKKAVTLSVDKYCGVMAMFKKFATVTTEIHLHKTA